MTSQNILKLALKEMFQVNTPFNVKNVPNKMKSRFAGQPDHLSICFWMWALFNSISDEDYPAYADRVLREIRDRGFNCVRMDDGAGLICDINGKPRGPINWHLQAGPYQVGRQSPGVGSGLIPNRLLIFCKAAQKYGIKLILSSWYYLHTNWQLDETINAELFEEIPTMADKIRYFTEEHNRILQLLRENNLLEVVAFVELCNEFEILKFVFTNTFGVTPEEAAEWRPLLEIAYECMKKANPELLFAYDTPNPGPCRELIPRNVDILNFHYYYMQGPLYRMLDIMLKPVQHDVDYPPEISRFLKKDRLHYEDVVRERSRFTKIRSGYDWIQRIMLFNSLDPDKIPELEKILSDQFDENQGNFIANLKRSLAGVTEIRDEVLPGAPLVMGEGVSCCTSDKILFEERSEKFWNFLEWQALFLRESGLWGTVVRTGSSPVDISWNMCAESFRKANELFLNGKEL